MGGAAVLNHGLVRFFLRRLGLVPTGLADFLDCCVDMTVLRRMGNAAFVSAVRVGPALVPDGAGTAASRTASGCDVVADR